jgi:hypothetical protein
MPLREKTVRSWNLHIELVEVGDIGALVEGEACSCTRKSSSDAHVLLISIIPEAQNFGTRILQNKRKMTS